MSPSVVVTLLHTGGPANDHHVIFDDYAGSRDWGIVHFAQFASMAVLVAGLCPALGHQLITDLRRSGVGGGAAVLLARFGIVAAGLSFAAYATSGRRWVALKLVPSTSSGRSPRLGEGCPVRRRRGGPLARVGDAELPEHPARPGVGTNRAAVTVGDRLPRALGGLMCLAGAAHLAQSSVLSTHGFSDASSNAITAGYLLTLAWTGWLARLAWKAQDLPTPTWASRGKRRSSGMLTLWRSRPPRCPSSSSTCEVMAGRLQWTSWRSTAHALISAHRVHCALRGCRGLVGHRFAVELRTRSVWTLSAWSTRTTLVEFSRGRAHSSVRGAIETALIAIR